ncbi:MAG TPA: hypothetical protein EYG11_17595 [Candidatus Latescibacteria bacterium]|nr:hypothetical protein [Candidatus Latescibacterota bacterium]
MNRLKLVLLIAALTLPVSSTQAPVFAEDSVEFDECNDMPWTSNNKKKAMMKCFKNLADTRVSDLQAAWDKRDGRRDEQLPRIEEWEEREANGVRPCDGVGIAELLLNGVGVENGGGGVVDFDTNDDGGIPDAITKNDKWKCTEASNREEVVIPDYRGTESFVIIDEDEVRWRIEPVDDYDDCSDIFWGPTTKGDKKNCFKILVRRLEEELENEAVHYDELEEAWTKKIQSFYVGRGDQSVDLYINQDSNRYKLWEMLEYRKLRILTCNEDYFKHCIHADDKLNELSVKNCPSGCGVYGSNDGDNDGDWEDVCNDEPCRGFFRVVE